MKTKDQDDYRIVYERAYGAKFCCGGSVLQVVVRDPMYGCRGCHFINTKEMKCGIAKHTREFVGRCERSLRTDRRDVKFVKIEDIPYAEE